MLANNNSRITAITELDGGRLVSILEGEGLVNDATALVMLRTAIAAVIAVVALEVSQLLRHG